MQADRASQLIGSSIGRAFLAGLVGFGGFDIDEGIDLAEKAEAVVPNLDQLETFGDPLALLSTLVWNPLGFGFSSDHSQVEAHLQRRATSLLKIAQAVVDCPAAHGWWDPIARDHQRWLSCVHTAQSISRGLALENAILHYVEVEITKQTDERAIEFYNASLRHENYSGAWWSAPQFSTAVYTSPPGPGELPCTQLATMEDPLGSETFKVWAIDISPGAKVYEVSAPEDWACLVAMAPVEVTVSRDPDWARWSGHHGPWFLPDWRVVGERFDAVHVSIGGYLSTRGTAIEVGSGYTLFAGWDAGTTLWLRDRFEDSRIVGSWTGCPGGNTLPPPFRFTLSGEP